MGSQRMARAINALIAITKNSNDLPEVLASPCKMVTGSEMIPNHVMNVPNGTKADSDNEKVRIDDPVISNALLRIRKNSALKNIILLLFIDDICQLILQHQ